MMESWLSLVTFTRRLDDGRGSSVSGIGPELAGPQPFDTSIVSNFSILLTFREETTAIAADFVVTDTSPKGTRNDC
ncbi:hypothetical protein GCM10011611_30750 [Aliidongia dinghuensis]|uniref:Uncharacterized protein n=1 Tax=Aliidongia dinghuensis TaxID=1867774 RepID=A0A8J3E2M1_9PROT|nr:hypothetical protein GCM10011611_30750 [Aliidongia dinghuensis]